MKLKRAVFNQGESIPAKFTCDGENVSPVLELGDVPENSKSMVLVVDDPDSPKGTFTHWVLFDIAPTDTIKENSAPGKQGLNDFNTLSYGGPCPGVGIHRYYFRLYALDCKIGLKDGAKRHEVEQEMEDHILDSAELMGTYQG